jgi:hypothetical protein
MDSVDYPYSALHSRPVPWWVDRQCSFPILRDVAQVGIIHRSIFRVMCSSMTIGTNRHDPPWMIRSPIGEASDMMDFKIGLSIRGHKWGSSTTTLTLPIGTTKRIQSDPLTSLPIERLPLHRFSGRRSIRKGFVTQVIQGQGGIQDR